MSDPFNPRRFLYESHSRSDRPDRTTFPPPTGRRTEAVNHIEGSPHPAVVGVNDADFPCNRHTFFIGLCTLLVTISAYSLGRVAERSSMSSLPHGGVSPDIRAYVDQAVLRLSRDSVGRPDLALYANGGRVIQELTGIARDDTLVLPYMDNTPNASLTDDTRVGSCWQFPQETGQLGFRTSEMLFPTHVTIDHIPIEIAADIGQAPRSMALWGAIDGSSNTQTVRDLSGNPSSSIPDFGRTEPRFTANLTFVILTTFEYDIYSPNNVQTFPLEPLIVDARMFFGVFILDIFSNWGGDATCLYRVRVHGESALQ